MRGLVAIYYVVLRTVLRNKPQLRRYRARCWHCRIFFIADPRNAGRKDLGCPFGCAEVHRRVRSTERSVAYNGTATGKMKRKQRRRVRGGPSVPARQELSELVAGAIHGVSSGADGSSVGQVPGDPQMDPAHASPGSCPPSSDRTEKSAEAPPCGREGSRGSSGEGESHVEFDDVEPDPRMVEYVRTVTSLIEGRKVSRAEIIEMLERARRQHSLARERRTECVLRRLEEEPEKPP